MNIAYLDIETTGLNPFEHEILEVAIIKEDAPHNPLWFSLPINESLASSQALEINKYYERRSDLQELQVPLEEAQDALREFLTGRLVVGNNVQFDLSFLSRLLGDQPWYYAPFDLKMYAAGLAGMTKPASTKFLAELADVPLPKDAHTALADCHWNREVYLSLTGERTPR